MKDTDSFAMDFDPSRQWAFNCGDDPLIDPPVLRVYLASPLTSAEPDTEQDRLMVREVTKRVLEDYDYLGIRFEVYDPGKVTPPGSEHSSEEVYVMDHNRTANADLVVFLSQASGSSLGRGHLNQQVGGVGSRGEVSRDLGHDDVA